MVKVLRSVLAIIAGLLVGFLAMAVGEMIGHHVVPLPPGMDMHDADALKAMPAGAFVSVLLAWAVGTFAGAWVASKVAAVGKLWHGMAIGGVFFAATVAIMLHIPHPVWVMVVGLVSLPPVAYLGAWLARPKTPKAGLA
jgi:hypothetical protein